MDLFCSRGLWDIHNITFHKKHLPKRELTFPKKCLLLNYKPLPRNPIWNWLNIRFAQMIFWFLCITTCHVWKYLVFAVMFLLCSALLSQDLLSWPNASLIFLFVLLDECMDFHKNAVITKTNSSSIYFAILSNAWSVIYSLECFSFLMRLWCS